MNTDARTFFNTLGSYTSKDPRSPEAEDPQNASQLLQTLSNTLENDQLTAAEFDDYIVHMFDESLGFPFIVAAIAGNKNFKTSTCIKTSFDILYTVTNNFPQKTEKYIQILQDTCLKIIRNSLVSADGRVRAFTVLILALEKINKCLDFTDHYKEIYMTLSKLVCIKKADSIHGKLLTALGMFAKTCSVLIDDEEQLKTILVGQLQFHIVQDSGNKAVSGAFDGLTHFSEAFAFDKVKDKDLVNKLFISIEKLLAPNPKKNKVANKAALTFLLGNMALFVDSIVKNYKYWHISLLNWLNYSSEDQKIGASVIVVFYQAFANYLMQDLDKKHLDITEYFLNYFTTIISDKKFASYEKKLGLQGLCSFSPLFHVHLSAKELSDLFLTIMQTFEQNFILSESQDTENSEFLPNYIEAVANFLHFNKITPAELLCLQKGTINMIKTFPQLPYWQQNYVVESLVKTFHCLKTKDEEIFDNLVENTVYQGVVWSCSHKHVSQLEFGEEKAITVKSYRSLWNGLLRITPNRKYDKFDIHLYDRQVIVSKIVDKLVRTLLILINKLNVELISIETETRGEAVTDLEARYKVAEVNDFAIYLNVVDFFQDVFHAIDPNLLEKCLGKLIKHMIEKCVKYPYISGFYKLLSFCLEIAEKLIYFESNTNSDSYDSLSKFLDVLLEKIQQFKDDLLISCLQVLIHYPVTIIAKVLPAISPAFSTIFHVGKSYTKLTDLAIDTMEKWQKNIPPKDMEDFLIQIVPQLDFYLRSKFNTGFVEFNRQKSRKTARILAKRKVDLEIEAETVRIQKKILNFIGRQNSTLCEAFVQSDGKIEVNACGDKPRLKVTFPFDTKIDFYADKLLPRIILLAQECTDRKTRVASCELLHSFVMIFLGNVRPDSKKSDYNPVFETMALPLLKLACDLDQVVKQLFEPLFFQMIHWYTHKHQIESPHTAILINVIMSGITDPTNAALRDFSGKCTREFIKWTIKQSSQRDLIQDPLNIKAVIRKMGYFSLHPDPYKKLGAALIFNNIYREFREETSLLSMFWIECLHIFVKGLSVLEEDVADTTDQMKKALKHLERGFVEKSELFNRNDEKRRIPPDIQAGLLKDVAVYLLKQTSVPNPHCREISMELFTNIAPRTSNFNSLKDFIDDPQIFLQIYQPKFLLDTNLKSNEDFIKWLGGFLLCLDGHNFIVTRKLTHYELNDYVINSVKFFLHSICAKKIDSSTSNIFQKQQFNKLKSQASLRLMHFLINLLNDHHKLDQFYSDDLWNFLNTLVFNPHELGFITLENFYLDPLELLLKKFPKNGTLTTAINKYVSLSNFTEFELNSIVTLKHRNIIKGLLFLQSCNLQQVDWTNGLTACLLRKFSKNLTTSGDIYSGDIPDNTLSHCLAILEYSLEKQTEFEVFTHSLYDKYQVQSMESTKPVKFGTYILHFDEEQIIKRLIAKFDSFIDISFKNHKNSAEQIVDIIFYIMKHLNSTKQLKPVCEFILKNIFPKWMDFEIYFNKEVEKGLEFIQLLIPIMRKTGLNYEGINKWLTLQLKLLQNLDLKINVFTILSEITDDSHDVREDLEVFQKENFSTSSKISQETKLVALEKLLILIPKIKNSSILQFILSIYTELPSESCKTDLQPFVAIFIGRVDETTQSAVLNKLLELLENPRFTDQQKYKLITNSVTLLQNCNSQVFTQFIEETIVKTIKIFKEAPDANNLMQKIIHSIFVEVLFVRNPITNDDELSPITIAAFPENPSNKVLLSTLIKLLLDACKTKGSDWSIRIYRCHSYNATVSIVSNAKVVNFYNKLFLRQENGKDILWHGLIDTDHKYAFAMDFDTIPKRRKVLINIRDELRAKKILERGSKTQSVRYVETLRIYNSSLSEDISKFDFSNSNVATLDESGSAFLSESVQGMVELDCVDVNNHECMASVCGLIEHLVRKGITELPEDPDEEYELPQWILGIRNLLLDKETHDNVKIFWVKVIDNTINIFGKLSKWFLEPLLRFVSDKCAGDSINYFVTDVVAILASWSSTVVPTTDIEITLASELLTYLIRNLNNLRKDIFKYHLELIKTIVEAWKSTLAIPYELILEKLSADPTSKLVEIGVHVASIFLANQIPPWSNLKEFFLTLCNVFTKTELKSIYKPCAETIGLVLRLIEDDADYNRVYTKIQTKLQKINDTDKYSYSLEAMVLHHPPIADEFHLRRILSKIHTVTTYIRQVYLKIILARTDLMPAIGEFKTEKWHEYLDDSLEVQILVLEVIYKNLQVLRTCYNFKKILEIVCKHSTSNNTLIRDRVYDIAMATVGFADNESCRQILVQGLTDNDREIREKVLQFWQSPDKLPQKITKRISFVLKTLYVPNTESDFLGYNCYLLLELLKHNDSFNQKLYEHPLGECDFEELKLHTDWRVRHLSVVPMFADTFSSFAQHDFGTSMNLNELRLTQQSFAFAPTQSLRAKQLTQFTQSESSLFIKPDVDDTFVNPNLVEISNKYRIPKRRFLRERNKIDREFAKREVEKSSKEKTFKKEQTAEKENKVSLTRSYRKGDLPDIQITLQALLEPLQSLVLLDQETAKMLFLELFSGISEKMRGDINFLEDISAGIRNIFENSIQYNTVLFRGLFDLLLINKHSIKVEPDLVTKVSQNSGLVTSGATLLEEYLILHVPEPSSSKRTNNEVTEEAAHWIKIAGLYKDLEEWDVVKSIFLEKLDCKEEVRKALLHESRKQWKEAVAIYKSLFDDELVREKKDFYYESCFKCFAHLGDWNAVIDSIKHVVGDQNTWNDLWDDAWNQQKLLPWYMTAQLRNTLVKNEPPEGFLANLNATLKSDKANLLQKDFAEELTMLRVFLKKTDVAKQTVNIYMENFLQKWQLLGVLNTDLRLNKILKLRNVVDIDYFIGVYDNCGESETELNELVRYFTETSNEQLPSIILNETRVLYRKHMLNLVKDKADFDINEVKFKLDLDLIEAAAVQNNFHLAKKYLEPYCNKNIPKIHLAMAKSLQARAVLYDSPSDKLDPLIKICSITTSFLQKNNEADLKLKAHLELFIACDNITSILKDDPDLFETNRKSLDKFTAVIQPEDLVQFAVKNFDLCIKEFVESLEDRMEVDQNNENLTILATCYLKLAYYTHKEKLFEDFMIYVLKAIKFNSAEARQLFPCILTNPDITPKETHTFLQEVETIPVWMFLGWIPQLLINVDSCKVTAVGPIILKIAQIYPQSIMYAYRLSKENYSDFVNNQEAKELVKNLDELLLKDERVDLFLKALTCVAVPYSVISYYIRKMIKQLQLKNNEQFEQLHKKLFQDFFNPEADSRDRNNFLGNNFKKLRKYKSKMEKMKTPEKTLKEINAEVSGILEKSVDINDTLSNYSPWLANFSGDQLDFDLEIPGQYDGKKMPLLQHHVRISGFHHEVSIMRSLRKPIKLTILGSDTKEYSFLVKFGEDLRQDQRIQQLFGLMNEIFAKDPSFNENIATFRVVPLTSTLGLIQWIDNTTALKEFITKSVDNTNSLDSTTESYYKFIQTNKNASYLDAYGGAALKYNRDKTIIKYSQLVSNIPRDVLRKSFWKLGTDVESFAALRSNFIKTYATMCVGQWILGIGDRHLENSLIRRDNGRVMGIDFGHAFGTGTSILEVPELVPIRLTPHLINLMEPLGERGLFREMMIKALKCLRENRECLLATMEVFVKEPSIDWLEQASRFGQASAVWYPVEKVNQAVRKLEGASSVTVMVEDLDSVTRPDKYNQGYIKLVKGSVEDYRSALNADGLSVEEQVDCLLDHACDYNLLGRMFHGWAAWI